MSKALVFLCVIGIAVAPTPEKKPGGLINCPPHKFSCRNRTECVFKSYWCDGFVDCSDRSDEGEHCTQAQYTVVDLRPPCSYTSNGKCYQYDKCVCLFEEYQCPANYAKCDDNLACILEIYFCDEFHDCKDKSDESAETCATTPTLEPSEVRNYLGRFNNRKTKNVMQKSEAKSKYRNDLLDQLARLISKSRK